MRGAGVAPLCWASCSCLAWREAKGDTRAGVGGEGPTGASFWLSLRVFHLHPGATNAGEAWEFPVDEEAQREHSKCFLDHGLTGSLTLQGPRTGRESDTLARITMARTGSLEGQESLNGPARRRGHSESPIFIDTAMTVPGTAVNQRNCWE